MELTHLEMQLLESILFHEATITEDSENKNTKLYHKAVYDLLIKVQHELYNIK